jgi:hypothetical protein
MAASSASIVADKAKPLARSYSCSALETDAIVSMIVGSLDVRSDATSYSFSGSWSTLRSITPTPGKSMYRHVSRSTISSTVRETSAEEDSATSAVGRGP